jgi:hypothetical protein
MQSETERFVEDRQLIEAGRSHFRGACRPSFNASTSKSAPGYGFGFGFGL